ncbi:MAG: DEAD/DEAH box helicase, partial [Phycisphaerales bacterium]
MAKRVRRAAGTQATPDPLARVREWFASKGWMPHPFQEHAWQAQSRGESGLVHVPTGAGKTFAAFLPALGELAEAPSKSLTVLLVTPLRAVSRDTEKALREAAEAIAPGVEVASRTGDTSANERARQRSRLPHVLVTTPESLSLMLASPDAATRFASLRTVIVDEWHELLASKRGVQVELALARLRRFSPTLRTWALSATLSNIDEAAQAAVGVGRAPVVVRDDMPRPIVVDSIRPSDSTRLPWAGPLRLSMLEPLLARLDPAVPTLLFTNTRSQAELWFAAILKARPEWAERLALHHGSIDLETRERIEAAVKAGSITLV